jgi:hypothetical protein
LNGGWDKYRIPEYKEPINNPMRTNEQKRIYNENKPKPYIDGKNQILNLQLYQPPRPKPRQNTLPNPSVFYPNYMPNPFDPIGYGNYLNHTRYNGQAPVYKEYNININGISGSHVKTAMLYEDILPSKSVATSFTTVGERINMYESIRAMLFSNGDGYDIPVDTSAYNILSHIKLMDINPYNASKYSNNPYKGLPYGFILYRSCYPIRHDSRNSTAQCSRNSTGVNVRVYRLTEGSYLINKQEKNDITKYDVWRDIAFYNYIKEEILKKKICPNFALMYGYNISLESRIDYENIMLKASKKVKKNEIPANTTVALNTNLDKINMRPTLRVSHDPKTGAIKREWVQPKMNPILRKLAETKKLNEYRGKSLVCLTEAPNYSIIGWAKKEYRQDGNIKRMINPGYHPARVWRSVIFQLFAALYTMQLKQIIINDFSLDRNVFIKDVDTGGSVTTYWKYIIDGIEYYIPNHGYILLIDSNYRDFDKQYDEEETKMKDDKRKITGGFMSKCSLSTDECNKKVFEMLKKAMDRNNFGQEFLNDNGAKLPDEILQFISLIAAELNRGPTTDISYYIRKFMSKYYIHNRIGTPLKVTETHVKRTGVKDFRKGQIVVMNDSANIDRFVLYISGIGEHKARVMTRDSIDPNKYNIIELDVSIYSLFEYSIVEPIKQDFDVEVYNLNEEALVEIYTLI